MMNNNPIFSVEVNQYTFMSKAKELHNKYANNYHTKTYLDEMGHCAAEFIAWNEVKATLFTGNCCNWGVQPLFVAVVAYQLSESPSILLSERLRLLTRATYCYVLAKSISNAKDCAYQMAELFDDCHVVKLANHEGNQKDSPMFCAILFEALAKKIDSDPEMTDLSADKIADYSQKACYLYGLAKDYGNTLQCAQEFKLASREAIARDSEDESIENRNPLYYAVILELGKNKCPANKLLKKYYRLGNLYAKSHQFERVNVILNCIDYIDTQRTFESYVKTNDMYQTLNSDEMDPVFAALAMVHYEQFCKAAMYYAQAGVAYLKQVEDNVIKAIETKSCHIFNDGDLAVIEKSHPLYFNAVIRAKSLHEPLTSTACLLSH